MSFNLKTNLVRMTLMLHENKVAAGKHVLFTYCILVAEIHLDSHSNKREER